LPARPSETAIFEGPGRQNGGENDAGIFLRGCALAKQVASD